MSREAAVTREHKLGLILGFSVLLAVAVLISDHFSLAQHERLSPAEPGVSPGAALALEEPERSEAPVAVWDGTTSSPSRRAEPSRVAASTPTAPLRDPLVIDQGGGAIRGAERGGTLTQALRSEVGEDEGDADSDGSAWWAMTERTWNALRDPSIARAAAAEVREEASTPERATVDEGREALEVERTARATDPGPAASGSAGGRSGALPEPAGSERMYVVKAGDTLFDICAEAYGDGGLWRRLAAYNAGRVGADGSVRSGVTLRMPTAAVLRASSDGSAPSEMKRAPAPEVRREPAARTRTYVVQKGDLLSVIAQRELGSSKRMGEIMAMNKDVLSDPDHIRAGMTLRLPAD